MATNLSQKLEALLFLSGEPIGLNRLASITGVDKDEAKKALEYLGNLLWERGLRLSEKDGEYMLVTAPELGKLVESYIKEKIGEELSRAALETLAVIAYKGPLPKSEIDYIRGVNSGFTVRNLMIRGLVERVSNPKDARVWLYRPTFEFIKFMGIEKLEKLPEYLEFRKEMDKFFESDSETGKIEENI